ncbi:RAB11-binding protein RELCH homolog [Rhopilema esculentum]|uniref:RAB11-binding protein RELCH homolog n=1 Tax=Rhopilema esculentum TaxID=499914 RepID=UPI0031D2D619
MEEVSVHTDKASRTEEDHAEMADQPSDVEINEVARRLLRWKFLLSALEVHCELCERGRELPLLRDFFSNPGNFETNSRYDGISISSVRRSASNLTLDSIDDFARYSDDGGRDNDDKVAVLEFELRRAKETIKELRENITEYAKENESSLKKTGEESKQSSEQEGPVKTFELRALNYLTNEFLLKNGYRLTAITFGEEVGDQDIDDWDDVGVNTPRPPNLLHLFRDYGKHVVEPVEKDKEEIEKLREQIYQLEMNIKDLAEKSETLQKENNTLQQALSDHERVNSDDAVNPLPDSTVSSSADEVQTDINMEFHMAKETQDSGPDVTTQMRAEEQQESKNDYEQSLIGSNSVQDEKLEKGYKSSSQEVLSNDDSLSIEDQLDNNPENCDNQSMDSFLDRDVPDETVASEDHIPAVDMSIELNISSKRQTTAIFIQKLFGFVQEQHDTRLMKEIIRASEEDDPIHIVSRCLPNVVPNVLLNKREELIPIILCLVRLHPDVKVRDNLLHMLFNLIKRPDDEQRRMIIDGCVAFARKVGPTRIEAELLPQCWEQITHKYPERRLLVAETCGSMAPYIPPELLGSLMFSMLRQMLEDDGNEKVREAATRSLALIFAFVDDDAKYSQAVDLLMKTLMDENEDVLRASREMLLPVIGVWTLELKNLQSQLLSPFLMTIRSILESATAKVCNKTEDNTQALSALDLQFKLLFQCCIDMVPLIFAFVLLTGPFDGEDGDPTIDIKDNRLPKEPNTLMSLEVVIGDARKLRIMVERFDRNLENTEPVSWNELEWVCDNCVSQVVEFTGLKRSGELEIMEQLVCFLCKLCRTFGKIYTYKKIIPYFEKLMRASELSFLEKDLPPICSPLLPLFICGVLSVFNEEEDRKRMCTFLKQSLVTIATQNFSLYHLESTFHILGSNQDLHGDLIQVLREALVHPSTAVRITTAPLLEILVRCVTSSPLFSQVASALITLSNDREFAVKVATVPTLGSVVETRTDKNLLEKVFLQLQSLMDDPGLKDNIELQKAMLRTFSRILPNSEPKFREEFLAHRIRRMAEANSFIPDLKVQVEMAREIGQTISAMLCCFISAELISSQIIPALRFLERDTKDLAPDVYDQIRLIITDAESKISADNAAEGSGSSLSGQEMKNKLLSGFNRLKDASTKKRDLFKKKERSSTLL